jgi:hypothetical protein
VHPKHFRECSSCLELASALRRIIELSREYEPRVKPQPLTHLAKGELEKAWQEALADLVAADRPPPNALK